MYHSGGFPLFDVCAVLDYPAICTRRAMAAAIGVILHDFPKFPFQSGGLPWTTVPHRHS